MTSLVPTVFTTGPKTDRGKAAVRLNAVSHGIMSTRPVVPGIESAEEWELHRRGVFESLTPDSHLEQTYVQRIAITLWRMNRIVRYETEEIALAQETAEDDAAPVIAARLEDGEDRLDRVVLGLPRDPQSLRRRLEQARLAATTLTSLSQLPGHESVPDDHAAAALQFTADSCVRPGPIPGRGTADRWTGATLRQALGHVAANQSLGDVIAAAIRYAQSTITFHQNKYPGARHR